VLPQTPVAEKTVRRSSVAVELVEDHVVVTPAGELDLAVQSDLIGAYQDAIALQVEPRIVVDLCRVTFMDSTALGTLVAAAKKVKARGGTLSVVGANDRIASLFHITKLDTVVPLCPEPGDARVVVVDSP
jgi:anti-sigma B factor antagonist